MYDFKDIFRSFSATLLQSNTPYSNMLPTHRHATRHIVRYFGRSTRFGATKFKYVSYIWHFPENLVSFLWGTLKDTIVAPPLHGIYTYYSNFQSQAVLSTAPGHVCFKLMLQTMFRPDGGMLGIFSCRQKRLYCKPDSRVLHNRLPPPHILRCQVLGKNGFHMRDEHCLILITYLLLPT